MGASTILSTYTGNSATQDYIADYLARENMSSIEVLITGQEEPEYHFLDYGEKDYFELFFERWKSEREGKAFYRQFVLDGIDKKDETIQIKIHIDRKRGVVEK